MKQTNPFTTQQKGNVMLTKTKTISISLCIVGLSACSQLNQRDLWSVKPSNQNAAIQLYPDGYDNGGAYAPGAAVSQATPKTVTVPETYHVNAAQPPVSFKNRDIAWIHNQNPQGYTIELATDEQPNSVAQALQKTPKNERMAEVKYQQNGKTYYKGIYGTYSSREAAEQALHTLPEDVKQHANIQTWNSIQTVVNE